MIIITGAAGFIGSVILRHFNDKGHDNILAVDKLGEKNKWKNLNNKRFIDFCNKDDFIVNLDRFKGIEAIIHMGACTDTAEFNLDYLIKNNYEYSKILFEYSARNDIPFIYASSAATYGGGENGYDDETEDIFSLKPLNPYGFSKQLFDQWLLRQPDIPPFWAGFKFFNVYGPNEYHKGRMASVIFHTFNQINETGKVKLFKSHRPDCMHGEQKRDFVYVRDVANIIYYFYENRPEKGIFNLGTGKARTFNDLAKNVIKSSKITADIEYIDMPEDIRDKYQYFTEAKVNKLRNAGYNKDFYSLEEGIRDYVTNFLAQNYKIL